MEAASVELVDVCKEFGNVTALSHVFLEIGAGERIVLLGPSGSGKSTLLRMVAGLDEPSSGEVRIAGQRVNEVPPEKRDVAMVFQSYALYPHMTVEENIAFPLLIRKVPKAERKKRVEEVAVSLGIADLLSRKPAQLSGGQRQRVALARALVRRPRVFLLDEPLSNLDAQLRHRMRLELLELQQQLGTTFIYVTHDQAEAMTLGQKVAVLKDGELVQLGSPLELLTRPANAFVAGFVGEPPTSVVSVSIEEFSAGGVGLVLSGARLGAPQELRSVARGCTEFLLGIPPEAVRLAAGGVPAQVEGVELSGRRTFLSLRLSNGERLFATCSEGSEPPAPSNTVFFELLWNKLFLFDKKTGTRLWPT